MIRLDDIDVSAADIQETQQHCYQILQEEHCSFFNTLKRLCKNELQSYFLTALIGLIVLIASCMLLPDVHLNIILLYFLLLGTMAVYEIYKQRICQMEEIMSVVPIHAAKCFLYKCVICSLLQLFCFLIVMAMESLFFDNNATLLIFHSILPVYVILSIVMLFERWIHSRIGVLIVYLAGYIVYLNFFHTLNDQFLVWSRSLSPYLLTYSIICILILALWLHTRRNEREGFMIWNLS